MKFISSTQQQLFYTTLEAYKAEFGAENIFLVIPRSWVGHIGYGKYYPIGVKVWNADWDSNTVGIRVNNFSANVNIPIE